MITRYREHLEWEEADFVTVAISSDFDVTLMIPVLTVLLVRKYSLHSSFQFVSISHRPGTRPG